MRKTLRKNNAPSDFDRLRKERETLRSRVRTSRTLPPSVPETDPGYLPTLAANSAG